MRFTFWYYSGKCGSILSASALVALLLSYVNPFFDTVFWAAIGAFAVLVLPTAAVRVLLARGRLKMKCPFCGDPGRLGDGKGKGTSTMECDRCGLVHGSGFWGLRLVAEPSDRSGRGDAE